jgi:Protein of unknown function (DUF3631)
MSTTPKFIRPGDRVIGAEFTTGNNSPDILAQLIDEPTIPPIGSSNGQARAAEANGSQNGLTEDELIRLAALSPVEYDKVRKGLAQRLGCQLGTLDAIVKAGRPKKDDGLQGYTREFHDSEPWPEPVDGATILNDVVALIKRYMHLKNESEADMVALWCAQTHIYNRFLRTPFLHVTSPDGTCGKSTLKDIVELCVNKPNSLANTTIAVYFRLADKHKPTMLLDEADKWLNGENKELVGAINAGWQAGSPFPRCEGDGNEVRWFDTFTPVALFGIGMLPANLHQRTLSVRLEKIDTKKPEEAVKLWTVPAQQAEKESSYDRKIARWLRDSIDKLSVTPEMPAGIDARLADNWRPLFAVAQMAGGDWPERALKALCKLYRPDLDPKEIRTRLLCDLRPLVEEATENGKEWLPTEEILDYLTQDPEKIWNEACRGFRPINEKWLASKLSPITSKRFRDEAYRRVRGYLAAELLNEISRYAPEPIQEEEGDSGNEPDVRL